MNELTAASLGGIALNQTPQAIDPGNLNTEQLEHVATEFEGVFISLMVKEMRNTVEGNGFFGGENSDSLGSMFDMFMGQHLAESKPLGIASLWLEQYENANQSESKTTVVESIKA